MPTFSALRPTRAARRVLVLLALLASGPAAAQEDRAAEGSAPLTAVDEQTRVRSLAYTFTDTQTFTQAEFDLVAALEEPGFWERGIGGTIASNLSFLPFFSKPGVYPFSPVTLVLDTRRLERYYARNGFLRARVSYLVYLDSLANAVDVTYVIKEGPPLRIDTVRYVAPNGQPVASQFPPAVRDDWVSTRRNAPVGEGDRLSQFAEVRLRDLALGFARNNGYAFAAVSDTAVVDTLANRADVTVTLDTGPPTVFGEIIVEGAESVDAGVVRRELPFRTGEPFRYDLLVEGQRELFGLNLFQTALVDLAPDQPADSTADVRVRLREGPPRLITASPGYTTESGVRGEVEWTHRNFFGGARTFTAGLEARTGLASAARLGSQEILYRASLSLQQPFFLNRRTSLTLAPYAQYRDDFVERSTEAGVDATALYERGRLANGSLQLAYSYRNVTEVRDPSQLGLLGLAQDPALFTQGFQVGRALVRLGATLGDLDDPLSPRRGFVIRPTLSATVPGLSGVTYGRGSLTALGFVPFTASVGVQARVTAGRVFPFGATADAADELFVRYRDAAFFAGGTADVRGWGTGQAGPRYPAYRFLEAPLALAGQPLALRPVATFPAGAGYVPVGGRAKLSGSFQLNLPFPGFGPQWGTFVFLDAGGVFDTPVDEPPANPGALDPDLVEFLRILRDEELGLRLGTGAGVRFQSAFGPIAFSIGYKLNPTYLDLRDPVLVYLALDPNNTLYPGAFPDGTAPFAAQPAFTDLPEEAFRRLSFHLTIGQNL